MYRLFEQGGQSDDNEAVLFTLSSITKEAEGRPAQYGHAHSSPDGHGGLHESFS